LQSSFFNRYALQYCKEKADPCLLLSYVILFNPYPVVWEDAKSQSEMLLEGKANHQNFGCHYVPIVEYGHLDFRPPRPGRTAEFDEIVIFQESHILPYAMVKVQEASSYNQSKGPVSEWTNQNVIEWMSALSLSKDYTTNMEENYLTGQTLLLMKDIENWKECGVTVDEDIQILCKAAKQLQL